MVSLPSGGRADRCLLRPAPAVYFAAIMDWNAWRAEFPILERKTYLNSCSLGALSRRAEARVAQFHQEWHTYGASAWYEIWLARLAELRQRVARLLAANDDEIALAASVSAALAVVASTLVDPRRNRVVVAELDFPTLLYQWLVRPDLEVVRVPSDDGATIDPERYAAAVDERTALIATSHVFFTTGAIQDLRRLADLAHRNGALLLVDAYQSVGQIPLDVHDASVDLLVTGPLKWLLGGPGLAYLYVRRDLTEQLVPRTAGWFGARDQFNFDGTGFAFRDDARRFELGTPALPTVHAALGGQEIIDEIGVPAIRDRNARLTEDLIARLEGSGFRLRMAPRAADRSAIVMVQHPDPRGAVRHLAQEGIIVDWRPGFVRISPHFYNTFEETHRIVAALQEQPEP